MIRLTLLAALLTSITAHAESVGIIDNVTDHTLGYRVASSIDRVSFELEFRETPAVETCTGNLITGTPAIQCSVQQLNQYSFGFAYSLPVIAHVYTIAKVAAIATESQGFASEAAIGVGVRIGLFSADVRRLHSISGNTDSTLASINIGF